jgi:polypeptide N-acetylgalactosaminyltransferase
LNKQPVSYFDDPDRPKRAVKIDWHNYDHIKYETARTGLGEQGKKADLKKVDKILKDAVYHANGYNGYLSDQISLNRSIVDTRHPK